ncbi:protein of unknown function [Candidatus Nitrosotalea okcheonensis]|uniref:Uncharacterized protein n=1 Tax=Candidatus Nitrosotalea okcheonensis TaxID=1903276 RepID=A0A2H1FEA3_9ARCH|nr:protein of unknown function [Candidatus Nitrosotalea okcheonensis]
MIFWWWDSQDYHILVPFNVYLPFSSIGMEMNDVFIRFPQTYHQSHPGYQRYQLRN